MSDFPHMFRMAKARSKERPIKKPRVRSPSSGENTRIDGTYQENTGTDGTDPIVLAAKAYLSA
jgi:hypothetical protein